MIVNVILERTSSNWCAYTPDEIGVIVSTGPTRKAVINSFREALKGHLEAMKAEGFDTPTVENLNIQELVPV